MKRCFSRLTLLAIAVSIIPLAASASVRYVKAGASGDGSSWASATGNLQDAIEASQAGDEVWVAAGIYKPDSLIRSNKPTSRAFFLKDGVSLYGGFAGNEATKEERQVGAAPYEMVNATILDGDDDVPDVWVREIAAGTSFRLTWRVENDEVVGTSGNASHVLYSANVISTKTVIDGFTLKGGNANVWNVKACGGALYAQGNVQMRACQVIENSAYFKAQSTSDSNTYGGAIFLNGSGDAAIVDCYIARCYSHSSYGNGIGGAIFVQNARVENCNFEDCVADDAGGAIYNQNGTVTGCHFVACYGGSGGAIYNDGIATGNTVMSCRGLLGGGIFNWGTASYNIVANCYADAIEYGETMGGRGGGILNADGMVLGSVVYNNQAFWGGGIYCLNGKVVNCTVQNNTLRAECDTANIGYQHHELSDQLTFNTIGNPNATSANFVAPTTFNGVAATAADTTAIMAASWQLAQGSQFIDAGTLTAGVSEDTDIAGNNRIQGESIDVGAYEYSAQAGLLGDVNGDGKVTATDITALYNFLLLGDTTYLSTSDINGDGEVTSSDVTIIYSILLGQ